MTTTDLPASGAEQPLDEAACRRLMISLFGEKAAALGTLLLRSAEGESAKSEPKPPLDAQFDASDFAAFMNAVHRRGNAIYDRAPAHSAEAETRKMRDRLAALRSNWRPWALAAAALLVIIIGSSLLYRIHTATDVAGTQPSRDSSDFNLAGESKPAPAPVTPTPPQQ